MHTICITDLSKTQVSSRVKWLSKAKYQHVFWVKGCFFSQRPRDKKKGNSCHHTLIKISFSFWRSTSNIYIIVLVWVLVYLSVYFLCSGFDFLVCISCCILYILWLSGSAPPSLVSPVSGQPSLLVCMATFCFLIWMCVCVSVLFSFAFCLQSFLDLFSPFLYLDLLGQVARMTTDGFSVKLWVGNTGDEDSFLIC